MTWRSQYNAVIEIVRNPARGFPRTQEAVRRGRGSEAALIGIKSLSARIVVLIETRAEGIPHHAPATGPYRRPANRAPRHPASDLPASDHHTSDRRAAVGRRRRGRPCRQGRDRPARDAHPPSDQRSHHGPFGATCRAATPAKPVVPPGGRTLRRAARPSPPTGSGCPPCRASAG